MRLTAEYNNVICLLSKHGDRTTKLTNKFLTVNGKRAGITISKGPWIEGVPQELIKVRAKRGTFPREIREALAAVVENNSDMREDYFESDALRLMPGHPLYEMAKAA